MNIINLSSYSSKSYVSVVFSDFEVTFSGEDEDVAFCPFLNSVLFIDNVV